MPSPTYSFPDGELNKRKRDGDGADVGDARHDVHVLRDAKRSRGRAKRGPDPAAAGKENELHPNTQHAAEGGVILDLKGHGTPAAGQMTARQKEIVASVRHRRQLLAVVRIGKEEAQKHRDKYAAAAALLPTSGSRSRSKKGRMFNPVPPVLRDGDGGGGSKKKGAKKAKDKVPKGCKGAYLYFKWDVNPKFEAEDMQPSQETATRERLSQSPGRGHRGPVSAGEREAYRASPETALRERWKAASAEEREAYTKMEDDDREMRYHRELAVYRQNCREGTGRFQRHVAEYKAIRADAKRADDDNQEGKEEFERHIAEYEACLKSEVERKDRTEQNNDYEKQPTAFNISITTTHCAICHQTIDVWDDPSVAFCEDREKCGASFHRTCLRDSGSFSAGGIQKCCLQKTKLQRYCTSLESKKSELEAQVGNQRKYIQRVGEILKRHRRESKRHVASLQLARKIKLEEKQALERELCELRRRNGERRAEIRRASALLPLCRRRLLEARSRSDGSREAADAVGSKLKRVLGAARLLGAYRDEVENAVAALDETETRLGVSRGRTTSRLRSATVRRDDAERRRESLLRDIRSDSTEERSIAADISEIRSEIGSNEQDLASARQGESQTRRRVEEIEHEVSIERTRHMDAVAGLKSKSKKIDESKANTTQSIEHKKVELERKKAGLHMLWERCAGLRKSEGHPEPDEPKWGTEQAPSLVVARVRFRVNDKEMELNSKKAKSETLHKDVSDLDSLIDSNATKAAEKRVEADSLVEESEKIRAEEALRKEDITKAVSEADLECHEAEKLRKSIKELREEKETNAAEVKQKLDGEESIISASEVEIASTIDELSSVEWQSAEYKAHTSVTCKKISDDMERAKNVVDLAKTAFERAQKAANDFSSSPDEELVLQTNRLNEEEQDILNDANRERDAIIKMEPLLGKLNFDFNSDVSLKEQKEAKMNFLKKYCEDFVETARAERKVRVDRAREVHLERLAAIKTQEEEETRLRLEQQEEAKIKQEEAAAKQKLKEEEEERRLEGERAEEAKRREEREAEAERKMEEEAANRQHLARLKEEEEATRRCIKRERETAARRKREEEEVSLLQQDEIRREEERAAAAEIEEARCIKERVAKVAQEDAAVRQRKEEEELKCLEGGKAVVRVRKARRRKKSVVKKEDETTARQREEEEVSHDNGIPSFVIISRQEEESAAAEEEKAAGAKRRQERSAKARQKKEEQAADRPKWKEKAAAAKKHEGRVRHNEKPRVTKAGTEIEKGRQEYDATEKCRREKPKERRAGDKGMQERPQREGGQSIGKESHSHREKDDPKWRARKDDERKQSLLESKDGGNDVQLKKFSNDAKKKDAANRRSLKSYSKAASKSRSKPSKPDEERGRGEQIEGAHKNKRSESSDAVSSTKSKKTGHQRKHATSSDPVVSSISKDGAHKRKRTQSSDSVFSSGRNNKRAKSSDTVSSLKSIRDPSVHNKNTIRCKDSTRPKLSTGASVRFGETANRPKMDIFSNKITKTKSFKSKQTAGSSKSVCSVQSRRRKKTSVGGKRKAKVLAMESFDDDGGFLDGGHSGG